MGETMPLTQKDLDGLYRISTVTDYSGPLPMQSDGETEIIDGQTNRVDKKGCQWNTRLTLLNEGEVRFESTADPIDADEDFLLVGQNGLPTRDPVEYEAVLKVSQMGNRIRLSGQIAHGEVITVITMIKE